MAKDENKQLKKDINWKRKKDTYVLSLEERNRKKNKIDHWRQTAHHLLSCCTTGGRESGGATKDTMKSQIWLTGGVTYAVQRTQTLLTC
jgi:hypothetical protein